MRRPTSLPYVIGFLLMNAGVALAGQTTLTTYYPAPSGNYDQLRLVPRATMSGSCLPGTLYVESTNNTLQYCDNSSAWSNRSLVWNQTGNNIYPADTASNPNINVGIGKTNPAYKLDVNGAIGLGNGASIASSITNLLITGGGIGPQVVQISDTLTVTGALQTGGNLNVSGNITASGSVTASGFFYNSDSRLKKNIHPITHALDKVQRLNGVAFTWKKNNVKDIGVTAQNVEKVMPELVTTGSNGMKSVAYGNLVALLIESVKEQQKEIEGLKKKVAELQNKQPTH